VARFGIGAVRADLAFAAHSAATASGAQPKLDRSGRMPDNPSLRLGAWPLDDYKGPMKPDVVSQNTFTFGHFPQLDGFRGLAILLVVVGHVLQFGFEIPAGGNLGALGVLLFFVLSGFLITGLLDREMLQTGHISLSRFYIRRILRLFPALFCFLALLCLLIELGLITDTAWYSIVACLIYVRNIWGRGASTTHIWSLSLEEQFYMLWPWMMRVSSRTAALWIAIAGVLSVSVFRMTAIHLKWFDYEAVGVFYVRPWFRFDSILIGCAVALLLCQSVYISQFRTYLSGITLTIGLWASMFVWTLWGEVATHVWYLTVQMIFATLILLNLLLSKDMIYLVIFSHPVAVWFGKISYSWYLWQQLFTVITIPSWFGTRAFPFNVAISLLLAVISYRFVEGPLLQMKDRITRSGFKSSLLTLPANTRPK
jgi:peptidoglycan/LPS O-acetylase OafA/YrhL